MHLYESGFIFWLQNGCLTKQQKHSKQQTVTRWTPANFKRNAHYCSVTNSY